MRNSVWPGGRLQACAGGDGVPVCVQRAGQGKRCRSSTEGVAATAEAMGPVPEVGAGPGPRVGGSD